MSAKFIVLFALLAVANAGYLGGAVSTFAAAPSYGYARVGTPALGLAGGYGLGLGGSGYALGGAGLGGVGLGGVGLGRVGLGGVGLGGVGLGLGGASFGVGHAGLGYAGGAIGGGYGYGLRGGLW